ncbi:hypothetical protein MRX96_031370 [Rhipicephalus microplus]
MALERRHAELCSFLGLSLVVLRSIRFDLQALNDEAVRVLESHAGAASVLALAKQDRQLVSALEDASPESAWHHERTSDAPFTYRPQTYSFSGGTWSGSRSSWNCRRSGRRSQRAKAVLTYLQSRGSRVPLPLSSECATIDRKARGLAVATPKKVFHPDDRHYDTSEMHRSRRPSGCQACGCIGRCRGRHAGSLLQHLLVPHPVVA